MEQSPWQHKYITITFKPVTGIPKSQAEMKRLLRKRITQKIEGDPSAYNTIQMWEEFFNLKNLKRNFAHGIPALEAFKKDLEPERFRKILTIKLERRKMQPSSVVSWIDLLMYHKSWVALIGAEYPERTGQIDEWERLFRLHMLYEQMCLSTAKLRSIFKKAHDIDSAMPSAKPVLRDMQETTDEIMLHFRLCLRNESS